MKTLTKTEIKTLKSMVKTSYLVKGQRYKIKWEKKIEAIEGRDVWGCCDCNAKIIYLDETELFNHDLGIEFAKSKLIETLFHELGHALHEECGLHCTGIPADYFEIFCQIHGSFMRDFFLNRT